MLLAAGVVLMYVLRRHSTVFARARRRVKEVVETANKQKFNEDNWSQYSSYM